jgi:mono/diheme cytochrome c family protein
MNSGYSARMVSRRVAIPFAIAALAAAGCGGGSSDNGGGSGGGGGSSSQSNSAGAKVFASAGCKNCHTLKAAGAHGTVGPNLDQLQPSAALVTKQVNRGGGVMPSFKGKLSPQQIKDVADYVSSVAGK